MNKIDKKTYTGWLAVPGILIYIIIFVIPTFASFYFSMTTWNLKTSTFIGLKNFFTFFTMANTKAALINTFFLCRRYLPFEGSGRASDCPVSLPEGEKCRISKDYFILSYIVRQRSGGYRF